MCKKKSILPYKLARGGSNRTQADNSLCSTYSISQTPRQSALSVMRASRSIWGTKAEWSIHLITYEKLAPDQGQHILYTTIHPLRCNNECVIRITMIKLVVCLLRMCVMLRCCTEQWMALAGRRGCIFICFFKRGIFCTHPFLPFQKRHLLFYSPPSYQEFPFLNPFSCIPNLAVGSQNLAPLAVRLSVSLS